MNESFLSSDLELWLTRTVIVMPTWKWIALIVAIVAGYLLKPILQYTLCKMKSLVPNSIEKSKTFWGYFLARPIEQPIAWLIVGILWHFAKDSILVGGNLDKYLTHILTAITGYYLVKLVYLAVEAVGDVLGDFVAKTESPMDDQLAPFATKTLKILVVVLGTLMIVQGFGLNVVSLLAGLGLGGLALALAAQDTAANVFGSITILFDQPFKKGDLVNVNGVTGTVEDIGFRSTRIRTAGNSLVAVPNAIIAKEKVENIGARAARRVSHDLGIHYDTPAETIVLFCKNVRAIIEKEEKVDPSNIQVFFNRYGDSALNIMIVFNARVATQDAELVIQERVLLEILNLAKSMNIVFAYPTRTVYHEGLNLGPQEKATP